MRVEEGMGIYRKSETKVVKCVCVRVGGQMTNCTLETSRFLVVSRVKMVKNGENEVFLVFGPKYPYV